MLGQNWEKIREIMRPFDLPIIGIVVILVAWFFWHRIKRLRAESAGNKDQ